MTNSDPPIKACVNCTYGHCEEVGTMYQEWQCTHPQLMRKETNYVTGQVTWNARPCAAMRDDFLGCGPEGILWEEKNESSEPVCEEAQLPTPRFSVRGMIKQLQNFL